MGSGFWFEAGALLPSLGVGLLFYFALRAILRADRREREADREAEREIREIRAQREPMGDRDRAGESTGSSARSDSDH